MIISVASGKGGTGKTTLSVNLALSLEQSAQFIDCDVEEPNSSIFIKPEIERTVSVSIPVPEVDKTGCNLCGRCAEVCAYNAIAVLSDRVLTFTHLCHGCGGCMLLCPEKAIKEVPREIGIVEFGRKDGLQFVHGRLNVGEALSPPLIRAVKEYINPTRTVVIDAPPGTSCSMVESVKGSDFCILVTEPTPFGLNDLVLAVEVLKKLKIPFGVAINRSDIGDEEVYKYCQKEAIPVIMKIPFRKEIASAYSEGRPIVEAIPAYKKEFREIFDRVQRLLDNHKEGAWRKRQIS